MPSTNASLANETDAKTESLDAELTALPFPVAYPLAHAADTSLPVSTRLHNITFTAYQAMRTTALVLLADYFSCNARCAQLDGSIRGLRMPHWSEWTALCRNLVRFWSGALDTKPDRPPTFPSLVEGWRRVGVRTKPDARWGELLRGLPGVQRKQAENANDALWKARNDRAHRLGTLTVDESEDARKLAQLLPIVEAELAELFPAGAMELVRRIDRAGDRISGVRLTGPHADLAFRVEIFPQEWSHALAETDIAAVGQLGALALYPLFASLDPETMRHEIPDGGLTEQVFLVNDVREGSVVLLGVRGHVESSSLVAPLMARLREKQVDFGYTRNEVTRWTLVDWARLTARDRLADLRGRKYFPECYVERPGNDDRVLASLKQEGKALLLLGEAGSSKFSLLARLVESLTNESGGEPTAPSVAEAKDGVEEYLEARGRGDVVVFLSGSDAYSGDAGASGRTLLCEAVLRRTGIRSGQFTDLESLVARIAETAVDDLEHRRRVILVLDGLNEAERFVDLVHAIDGFLPSIGKYPWLRLIMSMRTGAYYAIRQRQVESLQYARGTFENSVHLLHFASPSTATQEVPFLELRRFQEETEGRLAYERHQAAFPDRSANISWMRLPVFLRALLLSPLHLHLFHEAFAGATESPSLDGESQLFEKYLEVLTTRLPGLDTLLADIGRLMYETGRPELPLSVADEWLAVWRKRIGFDSALSVARLDPIEELVTASVLMRPTSRGVGPASAALYG